VRGKRRVATGRVERAMEKRVLKFGAVGWEEGEIEAVWFERMIARSIASFDVVGSEIEEARLKWSDGERGEVGDRRPDRKVGFSTSALT
jgi:hypothetical protein